MVVAQGMLEMHSHFIHIGKLERLYHYLILIRKFTDQSKLRSINCVNFDNEPDKYLSTMLELSKGRNGSVQTRS